AVRREALLLLQHADPVKAGPVILELAKQYDGQDRFYMCAVGIAVGHYDQKRRDIILANFEKTFADLNDKVAGLLWELQPPGVLPMLEKRLAEGKLAEKQRGPVVDILVNTGDKEAAGALMRTLAAESSAEVRERIVRGIKANISSKWSFLSE